MKTLSWLQYGDPYRFMPMLSSSYICDTCLSVCIFICASTDNLLKVWLIDVAEKRNGLIDWFWGGGWSYDGSLGDHSRGAGQAHAAVPEHHAGQRVSCSTSRVAGSVPQHCYESIVSNPDSLNSYAGLALNPDLDPESKIFSIRALGLLVNPDPDPDLVPILIEVFFRPMIEGKKILLNKGNFLFKDAFRISMKLLSLISSKSSYFLFFFKLNVGFSLKYVCDGQPSRSVGTFTEQQLSLYRRIDGTSVQEFVFLLIRKKIILLGLSLACRPKASSCSQTFLRWFWRRYGKAFWF